MIYRFSEKDLDLEKVANDIEKGLENPELLEASFHKSFSDIDFDIEYSEGDRYLAVAQDYAIEVESKEREVTVKTADNSSQDFSTSKYVFQQTRVELPERGISGKEETEIEKIDKALRSYARSVYQKQQPNGEDAWTLQNPPSQSKQE